MSRKITQMSRRVWLSALMGGAPRIWSLAVVAQYTQWRDEAVRSAAWSNARTWRNGQIPGDDANVLGTPGWGVVNHSSYVDVRNSVVYDFTGSAFATEAGDALGSFVGNLAAGGIRAPMHRKPHSRHAFGQMMERFDRGDLGFSGIGFWLAGPKVDLVNNVSQEVAVRLISTSVWVITNQVVPDKSQGCPWIESIQISKWSVGRMQTNLQHSASASQVIWW